MLHVGGKGNLGIMPHDLSYFIDHFIGRSVPGEWKPPPIETLGKTKRLRDFVSWMVQVPLVSQRVVDVFSPALSHDVEFLRFHELRRRPYYAMNVLRLEDIVDWSKSEVLYSDKEKTIPFSIRRFAFLRTPNECRPTIFKVVGNERSIFVNEKLAELIAKNELTGLALVDPGKDIFECIVRNEPLNSYPGILV